MKKQLKNSTLLAVVGNILTVYIVYMVCRVAYLLENWDLLDKGWGLLDKWLLLRGSLLFDTSAICYCLLMFLPLAVRSKNWWQQLCRWMFVVVNSLAVVANLTDTVYSQFTGRRTTATFFSEFQNEGNLGSIVGIELIHHWYLVLLGLALITLLWFGYHRPQFQENERELPRSKIILQHFHSLLLFLCVIPLAIIGIRGGASTAVRPIAMSNAMQYVNQPHQAALVLNTPFSFIRTLGKQTFQVPDYFPDAATAEQIRGYTSLHPATPGNGTFNLKGGDSVNVVILILESFGQEYIGAYNDYAGYTPFLDSLIGQSMAFRNAYSNGRKSIDAMPSVLSSIPMFVEPFVVTPYGLNEVRSIASELGRQGYHSAFFHGAENGSMGFEAFAHAAGYQSYYGRSEYDRDPRFGGEKDFDGTWAIWDEPFLQYGKECMDNLEEPFISTIFTATSHHPFRIPEEYEGCFDEGTVPIHKCIGYTDMSLRKFFQAASSAPWFGNTLFVITGDHTNETDRPEYLSGYGLYEIPILFYRPDGSLKGLREGVAQQTDIMPTVLSYLGYDKPYVCFGCDLLSTTDGETWAVSYSEGTYQFITDSLSIQFDGEKAIGAYDYRKDPLQKDDLLELRQEEVGEALPKLKSLIQQYICRMLEDRLTN